MGKLPPPRQVEDGSPFPSLDRPRETSREETRLSLAVGSLLERRDLIRLALDSLLPEHELACGQVADANARYEKRSAEEYVRAEGAVKLREKLALLASMNAYTDLQDALAARRITEKAMRMHEKDLEAIRALAWAHHQEVKTFDG